MTRARTTTLAIITLLAALAPTAGSAEVLSFSHSNGCAVLENGAINCWGSNEYGQTGAPLDQEVLVFGPTIVSGVGQATSVGTGQYFACALEVGGTVACWGDNSGGYLGDGSYATPASTTQLQGPAQNEPFTTAVRLSIGESHGCVVSAEGEAYCWGKNSRGQLGDGIGKRRNLATKVEGLDGVVDVATGRSHSCALLGSGEVSCWGANDKDQLGDGSFTDSDTPVSVPNIGNAQSIAAGSHHTCVALADGSVRCWGSNDHCEAGRRADNGDSFIDDLSGVRSRVAGRDYTCALRLDRTAECWGNNPRMMLSEATRAVLTAPTSIPTSDVVGVAAGLETLCTLTGDGAVRCWGSNTAGVAGADLNESGVAQSAPATPALTGPIALPSAPPVLPVPALPPGAVVVLAVLFGLTGCRILGKRTGPHDAGAEIRAASA